MFLSIYRYYKLSLEIALRFSVKKTTTYTSNLFCLMKCEYLFYIEKGYVYLFFVKDWKYRFCWIFHALQKHDFHLITLCDTFFSWIVWVILNCLCCKSTKHMSTSVFKLCLWLTDVNYVSTCFFYAYRLGNHVYFSFIFIFFCVSVFLKEFFFSFFFRHSVLSNTNDF